MGVPANDNGMVDVNIDDIYGLCVGLPCRYNFLCLHAILLAIYVIARPKHENEPFLRVTTEALKKLATEAGATELKVILGWLFNT